MFNKRILGISLATIMVLSTIGCGSIRAVRKNSSQETSSDVEKETTTAKPTEEETTTIVEEFEGNKDFDYLFLKLNNNGENVVYSPLSIKYALNMLADGTAGETQNQIKKLIGEGGVQKYENNDNMSLANAFFIRDTYINEIIGKYGLGLADKYDAEIIFDKFEKPNTINSWVNDKTLGLIDNIMDDSIVNYDFVLANALGIDMEWVNTIQPNEELVSVSFYHLTYKAAIYVPALLYSGFSSMEFGEDAYKANGLKIASLFNKYDIVEELGEENIRETVYDAYQEYIKEPYAYPLETSFDEYMDKYMEDLDSYYGTSCSSTDYSFYIDDEVKVFAKDLKEYNGTTLEYIGIMPTNKSLEDYIQNVDAQKVEEIMLKLVPVDDSCAEEGVVTIIMGQVPTFKMDFDMDLMGNLGELGITDVFTGGKADLSAMTTREDAYIASAKHMATIEFSNEGIKAGAATTALGKGDGDGDFNYRFDVPIKEIDLTFDNPYMYIIRDKETGTVWFAGAVYEPDEWIAPTW